MKLETFDEICCDDCYEVIHVHFKCPICKDDYAGTNLCESFWDMTGCGLGTEIKLICEECNATFLCENLEGPPAEWNWVLQK